MKKLIPVFAEVAPPGSIMTAVVNIGMDYEAKPPSFTQIVKKKLLTPAQFWAKVAKFP